MDAFAWGVVGSVAGVVGAAAAIVFGLIPLLRERRERNEPPSTLGSADYKSAAESGSDASAPPSDASREPVAFRSRPGLLAGPGSEGPSHVGHVDAHLPSRRRNAEIFRGTRQRSDGELTPNKLVALILAWVLAFCATGLVIGWASSPSSRSLLGASASFDIVFWSLAAGASWIFVALDFRFRIGFSAKLVISSSGISFSGSREGSGPRENFCIQRSEVSNFYITNWGSREGRWLAATPLPGSPLVFRGPSSRFYDLDSDSIMICGLADVGIQEHVIVGALKYWGLISA